MSLKSSPASCFLQLIALAVSLATNASASTLCISGYCDFPPAPPIEAVGPVDSPNLTIRPWVLQILPLLDVNGWGYYFSIGGLDIVSISVPYFEGWETGSVITPDGWTYQIVPASNLPLSNDVALWERQVGMPASDYSAGASFTSKFPPTIATVEIRDAAGSVFDEQLLIPLTPRAISAGYTAVVPIPASILLFSSALIGLGVIVKPARKLG